MSELDTQETIGFIGLGDLGLPMAKNLMESGYNLAVHNRTAEKAADLVKQGARFADQPADVVTRGGIVVTMLWDDAVVEKMVGSAGFLERLGAGGVHVCMCTGSPEGAKRLAALHAAHGSVFIEAPVFGRPEAAVARQLSILFAGPAAEKERVRPLLTAMGARGIFDFGEQVGAARVVKLAGNFMILSAVSSMVEAFTMVEKAGVDARAAAEMLTQTMFAAPVYQIYARRIVQKEEIFTQPGIALKDLGFFEATAKEGGVDTLVAQKLGALLKERTT